MTQVAALDATIAVQADNLATAETDRAAMDATATAAAASCISPYGEHVTSAASHGPRPWRMWPDPETTTSFRSKKISAFGFSGKNSL